MFPALQCTAAPSLKTTGLESRIYERKGNRGNGGKIVQATNYTCYSKKTFIRDTFIVFFIYIFKSYFKVIFRLNRFNKSGKEL